MTSRCSSGRRLPATGSSSSSRRRCSSRTRPSAWRQLALLPVVLVALCAALALTETLVAKMRILLVPRLLGVGAVVALLGVVAWLVGTAVSGALAWVLVALGLGVVVVRRRSVAVALVTAQALVLAGVALAEAATRDEVAAAAALGVRGARARRAVPRSSSRRTREPRPVRAGVAPLARAGARGRAGAGADLARAGDRPRVAGRPSARCSRSSRSGSSRVATRRATLFQVLGIVLVENGLALAALELPGGVIARDRARRRARPDARRARRGRLPRADLRRVRRRRHRRAEEPA